MLLFFSVGNVPETPSQLQPIGSKTGLNAAGEIPVSLHINLISCSNFSFFSVSVCLSDQRPGQVSPLFTDLTTLDTTLTHRLRGHQHSPESVVHRVSNLANQGMTEQTQKTAPTP